jgi:hypothetical protein
MIVYDVLECELQEIDERANMLVIAIERRLRNLL